MKQKIYYHHTDCGGVVYYANYLNFLEEARTEFLAGKSISIKELAQKNTLFVVSRQEIDYKLPAFYADILTMHTRIGKVSRVSIEFDSKIENQDKQAVVLAKTILVCVQRNFKLKSIPQEVRRQIS